MQVFNFLLKNILKDDLHIFSYRSDDEIKRMGRLKTWDYFSCECKWRSILWFNLKDIRENLLFMDGYRKRESKDWLLSPRLDNDDDGDDNSY